MTQTQTRTPQAQTPTLFGNIHVTHTLHENTGEAINVDLFAGGGGATSGLKRGLNQKIHVAVNHNVVAISAHRRNNTGTRHYHSDVFEVDPLEATGGRPVNVLWASPDCTSFSPAKGAAPIRRGLRALPWVVPRWAAAVRPRFIVMENVSAISTTWGPLVAKRDKSGNVQRDKNGRMLLTPSKHPKKRNRHWQRFVAALERLGYHVEYRELNAANYGAATTRKRLFLVASRDHEAFEWPQPTHAPASDPRVLAGELLPWVGVDTAIDFRNTGRSIFDPTRSAPLKPDSLMRVAIGVSRHILNTEDPYIIKTPAKDAPDLQAGTLVVANHDNAPAALNAPAPTITTQGNRLNLVTAHGLTYHKGHPGRDLRLPIATITAGGTPARPSTGNPFGLAAQHWERVGAVPETARAPFISKQYGLARNRNGHSISVRQPAGTITTVDHHAAVQVTLAAMNTYYGGVQGQTRSNTPREPTRPQTTSNRHALTSAPATGHVSFAAALDSLTGEEKARAQAVHDLITRLVPESAPFSVEGRALGRMIQGQAYVLKDITMRMLEPGELKIAQGFDPNYNLELDDQGKPLNKDAQVKLIGNSVPPPFAEAIGKQLRVLLEGPHTPRAQPEWLQRRRARATHPA